MQWQSYRDSDFSHTRHRFRLRVERWNCPGYETWRCSTIDHLCQSNQTDFTSQIRRWNERQRYDGRQRFWTVQNQEILSGCKVSKFPFQLGGFPFTLLTDNRFFFLVKTHVSSNSLVLRIRCDAKVSQCPLGEKYGCNPNTEATELITLAKSLGLNVSVVIWSDEKSHDSLLKIKATQQIESDNDFFFALNPNKSINFAFFP